MIIVNFPKFIQRILKNLEENFYHVIHGCSNCGYAGNLHRHASYQRNVICKSITARIRIQRVICPDCGKTHALIPSDLIPYFQHTLETILNLLELINIKKQSYSEIIKSFRKFNLSFSLGHISLYIKRFNTNMCKIEYYFRVFNNIFLEPSGSGAVIITKFIDNFNLQSLNTDYSSRMDSYFLSKVVI
jgi:predicted RNA-binding Zn-ribbon protein involved in translation (DUF1610 family)